MLKSTRKQWARQRFLDAVRAILTAAVFCGMTLALPRKAQSAPRSGELPNVVLLFIDDMGYTAPSCYGNEHVETPHIDRLAQEGVRFTQAYVTPQCTPSRACLMTGQHTARNRMWHVVGGYCYDQARMQEPPYLVDLPREVHTMPEALQDAGYTTGFFGKWHLNRGITEEEDGYYFGVRLSAKDYYGWDTITPWTELDTWQSYAKQREPDAGTEMVTDAAVDFIANNAGKPFYAYVSYFAVHSKVVAPDSLVQYYRNQGAPENGQNRAVCRAAIKHLDNNIGRILQALESRGILDNTLVMFLSDNGAKLQDFDNGPLRLGKGSPYEGGIRVPFIARWPGVVAPGSECRVPVNAVVDMYPTLLDAAGAALPDDHYLDGSSMKGLFAGEQPTEPPTLFWYLPLYDMLWGSTPCAVMRQGDYKLIEFFGDYVEVANPITGPQLTYIPEGRVELYDLANDIGETRDLSGSMPARTAQMRSILNHWIDTCNAPRPYAKSSYNASRFSEVTRDLTQCTIVNMPPAIVKPLPDVWIPASAPASFGLPADAFVDYDGNSAQLVVEATDTAGGPLPAWLSFDAGQLRFSATAPVTGALAIEVSVTDNDGGVAHATFTLTVGGTGVQAPASSGRRIRAAGGAGEELVVEGSGGAAVQVLLMDLRGRTVSSSVKICRGAHRFDASTLGAGMYFAAVSAARRTVVPFVHQQQSR